MRFFGKKEKKINHASSMPFYETQNKLLSTFSSFILIAFAHEESHGVDRMSLPEVPESSGLSRVSADKPVTCSRTRPKKYTIYQLNHELRIHISI